MAETTWPLRLRSYERERQRHRVPRSAALDHPLVKRREEATPAAPASLPDADGPAPPVAPTAAPPPKALDPLSMMLATTAPPMLEPLRPAAAPAPAAMAPPAPGPAAAAPPGLSAGDRGGRRSWKLQAQEILAEYQLSGSLRVVASLMREGPGGGEEELRPTAVARSRLRLQQLENGGKKNVREVSQKELTAHLDRLYAGLQTAWAKEERVRTLRLAVQCADLLADTAVPGFYPSLFVQVTEVMDRFGRLVYDRIRKKSEAQTGRRLPEAFRSDEVGVEARETCRNWFYKVAGIRDLVPRLYVEISLLRCYRFLSDGEFPQILGRIASIIRGIGDPLLAVYARTYLTRVGTEVAPEVTEYASRALFDYMFAMESFAQHGLEKVLKDYGDLAVGNYLHLHAPAVRWLCESVGAHATPATFSSVLQHFRQRCPHTMILNYVLQAFDPALYAGKAAAVVLLIKESTPGLVTHTNVLATLGRRLADNPPPPAQRLSVLNETWRVVSACADFGAYAEAASAWLEVLVRHYSEREVLVLLGDLGRHLAAAEDADAAAQHLEHMVLVLVQRSSELGAAVLTSEHLLRLLDVFRPEKKLDICKDMLEAFGAPGAPATSDPILIHTVLGLGRTLHDALDSLSPEGDRRHAAQLLCGFCRKIDFGKDLEQQLQAYVEARAAFANLDAVLDWLCLAVAALAMRAHALVRGRHTKKTGAFVKACMAYCHITIPSIEDPFRKLTLLLHCGNVSLCNDCLPQTDTFFKCAVSMIPELPLRCASERDEGRLVHAEATLFRFLQALMAALVCCPGHPRKHGPFYLVQGLLNALPRFEWQEATPYQTQCYIQLLGLLGAYAQPKLPYAIAYVASNDTLYARSEAYVTQLDELTARVMEAIIGQLAALKEKGTEAALRTQFVLVLELAEQMLCVFEPTLHITTFVTRLLGLARASDQVSGAGAARWRNTLDFVRRSCLDGVQGGHAEALQPLSSLLAASSE